MISSIKFVSILQIPIERRLGRSEVDRLAQLDRSYPGREGDAVFFMRSSDEIAGRERELATFPASIGDWDRSCLKHRNRLW